MDHNRENKSMSKFQRGTIAINDAGQLGYIQTVYEMEMGGVQCGGFRLDVEHGGENWRAINPKYVTHVDDLTKRFDGDMFTIEPGPDHRSTPVVVDSPLRGDEAAIADYERKFWSPPQRDDDPVHDCSEGVISHSPVVSRPARRSCI